jgi:methionyl-tRNA formyltransferase
MGKDKPSVIRGLRFLVQNDVEIAAVVGPRTEGDAASSLAATASALGLPVCTDEDLYRQIEAGELDVDLVVSFLFWKRIRGPLLVASRLGCINLHPAPLPDFRGVSGYSIAICEGLDAWGVSAHFVDEAFDTGDLIEVRRFPIDAATETALTLERKSQIVLLQLFEDVISGVLRGEALPRSPQGEGRYVSREEFERLRRIDPADTPEDVERKIRAFWYPPHGGAYVDLQGVEYTLVDARLLREIADLYETHRD